jgi:hypothetical protein
MLTPLMTTAGALMLPAAVLVMLMFLKVTPCDFWVLKLTTPVVGAAAEMTTWFPA